MQVFIIAMVCVILAGACISIQAPINAALARGVGSPLVAASISFGVGFVLLTLAALVTGDSRGFVIALRQDWLLWIGGFLGAFYVWTIVWTLPHMGVLTAICALALGQMVAAIIMDRIGFFGLQVRDISIPRLLAAAMVGGGLILSRY